MKMIIKPRPGLGADMFAVKVKGVVATKGTEKECLAWIKANKGEAVYQDAGKASAGSAGKAPKAPRAPKAPKVPQAPKKPAPVRAKKGGSVTGPLPKNAEGVSECPTGVAQNGETSQRRRQEPPRLNLPEDSGKNIQINDLGA
jgi:hypothetical protein